MKVTAGKGRIDSGRCDGLALLFLEGKPSLDALGREADRETGGALSRVLKDGFEGKRDQVEVVPAGKRSRFGHVVLLGLGKKEKLDAESFRRAGGALAGALDRRAVRQCRVALLPAAEITIPVEESARALSEGALLRSYRFTEYKKPEDGEGIQTLVIFGGGRGAEAALARASVIGEEHARVRDLINRPARDLGPEDFAREARAVSRELRLACRVYTEKDLRRMGYNSILAVGQGSSRPPRLVVMSYRGGAKGRKPLALVGKGIVFDSGGISIKPAQGMEQMKGDMAGAATVLGALKIAARLKLRQNLIGVMPLAENLPAGSAQRPGDIIRTPAGVTVEVMSTDAEGRLVLADGIYHATRLEPRAIIDVATLTGAAFIALGSYAIGLMGNNEELLAQVTTAGIAAGERTWILPLWEEYEEILKSEVADLKNNSWSREAGTICGGIFLKKFVGEIPWAHLDIAGVDWNEKSHPYLGKGPTAKGLRLLVRLLEEPAA